MKLLMISGDRSILAGKRGAFWYTLQEFSKHWERIDVITPRGGNQTSETGNQKEFENVFFHPCPWPLLWQKVWIMRRGYQLVAEHHHDVMTVHEYPPFFNGFGARNLHRMSGIPYVLEVHHIVGVPVAASLTERIGRFLSHVYLPWAAQKANGVRVVSQSVAEQLQRWGVPRERLHLVPSFYLDAATLRPDPSIQQEYDVVCAARFVANKGLVEVINAMALLPGKRLLLIGDGPLRVQLASQVRAKGMEDRVTFAGWLPTQEDLVRALQSARVFVMNSQSEGGPRSALEAMALGLPVISTRVGVMPEVIRDGVNGVFTNGSAEDLSQKIDQVLSDPSARERMGQAARGILGTFERKKLIREYAEFLKGFAKR